MYDGQSADALEQLKQILLLGDRRKLSLLEKELIRLREQLQNKEELIETLHPVLTQLLDRKIVESRDEVARSLAPVISSAIKHQIETAKDEVADALYPVIGQTIRKAVAEAMKNLAHTVNTKVDRALSFSIWRLRLKSWFSGVPLDQLILNDSLPFQLREIFFIHKNTGLLLTHVSANPTNKGNQDLISGMLTAIRDFATSAFAHDDQRHELSQIEYDDFQIVLEEGRTAYLAVVVSGVIPDTFAASVSELNQNLHRSFAAPLKQFSGDVSAFKTSEALMNQLFRTFNRTAEQAVSKGHKPRGWIYLIILIGLVLLLWRIFVFRPENTGFVQTPQGATTQLPFNRSALIASLLSYDQRLLDVDFNHISFIQDDGLLTVEGRVNSMEQRLLLARSLAEVSGFDVIINNLTVNYTSDEVGRYIEGLHIYFDPNQWQLDQQSQAELKRLAEKLNTISFTHLIISGHSDDSGSAEKKLAVSLKRAEAVRDFLVDSGIDGRKMSVTGLSDTQPEQPNDSPENRGRNRRVSFAIE